MDTSLKTIAPAGRICEPIACVKCGGELQGVSIVGVCPGCGEPVRSTIAARTLDNPDYARRAFEDYGMTLKIAGIAPAGLLLVPVLGPFAAVVVAGAGFVRLSATGRILRSGMAVSSRLGRLLRAVHGFAWVTASGGALVAFALLHDAFGRWGTWLSPEAAFILVAAWSLAVTIEIGLGLAVLLCVAPILEVGWFSMLTKVAMWALGIGFAVQLLFALTPPVGSVRVQAALQILFAWIPLLAGGWLLGSLVDRVGGAVTEIHWMSAD